MLHHEVLSLLWCNVNCIFLTSVLLQLFCKSTNHVLGGHRIDFPNRTVCITLHKSYHGYNRIEPELLNTETEHIICTQLEQKSCVLCFTIFTVLPLPALFTSIKFRVFTNVKLLQKQVLTIYQLFDDSMLAYTWKNDLQS